MKTKLAAYTQRYLVALRRHLSPAMPRSSRAPPKLGREAVKLGLETLQMARLHEKALATLFIAPLDLPMRRHAARFFSETIIPIERTHGAARQAVALLNRLNRLLGRRTRDLSASHRFLRQGIARRKKAEKALETSRTESEKLLSESRRLQAHLRKLAHQLLSSQEGDRQKISRDLHDGIVQNLVGINVRLLTLKQGAALGGEALTKEIASTRLLVDNSICGIQQVTRGFGLQDEK